MDWKRKYEQFEQGQDICWGSVLCVGQGSRAPERCLEAVTEHRINFWKYGIKSFG